MCLLPRLGWCWLLREYKYIIYKIGACPYGNAFIDLILGDLDHDGRISDKQIKTEWYPDFGQVENLKGVVNENRNHDYAECSNEGLCDRTTGECKCFPGYEGSACQRKACPTTTAGIPCSGKGVCIPSRRRGGEESTEYCGWELDSYYTCLCDNGYTGYDCSLRICPKGADPIDKEVNVMKYTYTLPHNHTIYRSLAPVPTEIVPHYYTLEFDGVKYESPMITARELSTICKDGVTSDKSTNSKSNQLTYQEEIRRALHTIPPISQSKVTIQCERGKLDSQHGSDNVGKLAIAIDIEYTNYEHFKESTFNVVEVINPKENDISGTGTPTWDTINPTPSYPHENTTIFTPSPKNTEDVYIITKADKYYTERKVYECSARGLCDQTTGLCKCFEGFYGAACEVQRQVSV